MDKKEYIKEYKLLECWYSEQAEAILRENPNNEIINVTQYEKEIYKRKNDMNTFPQIFYVYEQQEYKIGGYNDLKYLIDLKDKCKKINENKYNKIKHNVNIKEYKIFLRLLIYLCTNI